MNSALQGNNLSDELIARGLPEPNKMKKAYDINPSMGGPLMRDKLWFYVSARWQSNENYIAGLYDNENAGDPTAVDLRGSTRTSGAFSRSSRTASTRG